MKSLMVLTSLLVATMTAVGQGYVNFASAGAGVNAPMSNSTYSSGFCCPMPRLSGPGFKAMLYVGPVGTMRIFSGMTTNGVEGPPATFLTGAQAGYFTGGTRAIAGFSPGDTILAQVRVWNSSYPSWEAAPGGEKGLADAIQVQLGTAVGAAKLVGLQGKAIGGEAVPPRYVVVSNATVRVGNTVTLVANSPPNYCEFYTVLCAYPPPFEVVWSFHGTNISFGRTLTITNARPSDAGTYAFHVENLAGSMDVSATLTVTGSPPAALISPIYSNGGFQFSLTGEAGSNYVIQSSTDLAVSNWISRVTNAAPFTFVETNFGLSPQRFYRAINR